MLPGSHGLSFRSHVAPQGRKIGEGQGWDPAHPTDAAKRKNQQKRDKEEALRRERWTTVLEYAPPICLLFVVLLVLVLQKAGFIKLK